MRLHRHYDLAVNVVLNSTLRQRESTWVKNSLVPKYITRTARHMRQSTRTTNLFFASALRLLTLHPPYKQVNRHGYLHSDYSSLQDSLDWCQSVGSV